MSHLIPERRVDKNGRTTTRHVRAVPAAPADASSLPSPRVAVPVLSPKEAAAAAWSELEDSGMRFSSGVHPNLEYIATHDREMLYRIVERYTGAAGESERALWQGMIVFTGMCPELNISPDDAPPVQYLDGYRHALEFFPFMARLIPTVEGRTVDHYRTAAMYFNVAAGSVPQGLERTDPDAIKAVLLVLRVEEARDKKFWDVNGTPLILSHKRGDILYLAKNMEKVSSVMEGLVKLKATDSQAVESLLGTESPLRDGAL